MIANGIFISRLIYLIPLWGGCESYLLNSLQKIQNKAARFVTRQRFDTPIKTLLKQCGWMSVRQLVMYHSLVLLYKVLKSKHPKYIFSKMTVDFSRRTRQTDNNILRLGTHTDYKLELAGNSFRWRTAQQWNNLPVSLRNEQTIEKFKSKLKLWIMENVPI